jgi:predicted RecA/RadA family phage recombinase
MLSTPQNVPAVYAYSGLDGIDWYNGTGAIVTPGQVIKLPTGTGVMYGITRQTIPIATWGNLAIVGIFDLLLDGASTFVQGDVVYWNANLNVATSAGAYSSDIIGICAAPTAAQTDVSVRVWLTSAFLKV